MARRHSRSPSRSRDRRRRSSRTRSRSPHSKSRHRDRSRERNDRRHKSRRHRRTSSGSEDGRRYYRERSRSPPPPPPDYENVASTSCEVEPVEIPSEISKEIHDAELLDVEKLSPAAKEWINSRIDEQVKRNHEEFNNLLEERVEAAIKEREIRLRAQIEMEYKHELDEYTKRDEESRKRCEALEADLRAKVKALHESEMEMKAERLRMLEAKNKLDTERLELQKERQLLNKADQSAILNKGGALRAPIKLKFGK